MSRVVVGSHVPVDSRVRCGAVNAPQFLAYFKHQGFRVFVKMSRLQLQQQLSQRASQVVLLRQFIEVDLRAGVIDYLVDSGRDTSSRSLELLRQRSQPGGNVREGYRSPSEIQAQRKVFQSL